MFVRKKKYLFTVERVDELNKELAKSNKKVMLLEKKVDELESNKTKSDVELEKNKHEIDSLQSRINVGIALQDKLIIERDVLAKSKLENETKKVELIKLSSDLKLLDDLNQKIQDAEKLLKELEGSISRTNNEKELQEVSFYKNIYPFLTTEEFKEELNKNYSAQKLMIKNEDVILVGIEWEVSGSRAKGRKMTNQLIKSTIRAYNTDCDNAITKLRYRNYNTIVNRIEKSYTTINKLNTQYSLTINEEYHKLKMNELKLVYELKIFEEKEKEKLRILREEIREQKAVEKEIKERINELNQREKIVNNEINKINKEFADSKGLNVELLNKIKELEDSLGLITKKKEEVNERHLVGKSGYVYVISNIGTLGENVYKIGMTRRLEPRDRIRELSGAGVPFVYDVHAMILTDNAPKLENHLHKVFDTKRINLVNTRKEFFNVQLEEIKREIISIVGPEVVFESNDLAEQFYMSQALRNNSLTNGTENNNEGMYSFH